jgi:filamentous hemagglutinin
VFGISAGAAVDAVTLAFAVGTLPAEGALAYSGEGGAGSAANAALLRNELIAKEIAGGHAFEKHVIERAEFSGISTRGQFASLIEDFLNAPGTIMRNLKNCRVAYWNSNTGTVLIRNPNAADGGTFFKPTAGIQYFWDLQ